MQTAVWRKVADYWQYHVPGYAVIGTVSEQQKCNNYWTDEIKTYFRWVARVDSQCRLNVKCTCKKEYSIDCEGLAATFEGAKRMVELALAVTNTLAPND